MLEEQLPSRADRDGILFSGYPGYDNRTVREYLAELEMQNPVEEPTHSQDKVSTADPDSTYATKGGTPARMGYYNTTWLITTAVSLVRRQPLAGRGQLRQLQAETWRSDISWRASPSLR